MGKRGLSVQIKFAQFLTDKVNPEKKSYSKCYVNEYYGHFLPPTHSAVLWRKFFHIILSSEDFLIYFFTENHIQMYLNHTQKYVNR